MSGDELARARDAVRDEWGSLLCLWEGSERVCTSTRRANICRCEEIAKAVLAVVPPPAGQDERVEAAFGNLLIALTKGNIDEAGHYLVELQEAWESTAARLAEVEQRAVAKAWSARERALEEAARIAEHPNAGLVPPDGGAPTPREMCLNIAAEIRARASRAGKGETR